MEVMIPASHQNSDFDSKSFGDYYFSAPTSPTHLSQFYSNFDGLTVAAADGGGALASVPFAWEEKPGIPKSPAIISNIGDDDFVFDLSQDWETASLSAEELFDGGVIKPFKPPPPAPPLIAENGDNITNSGVILVESTKARSADQAAAAQRWRGRERGMAITKSSSQRAARSLSPLRDRDPYPWEKEDKYQPDNAEASSSLSSESAKKWKLMDFFLFRSASEGRAADKDPLKKYTAAAMRRSSFRAVETPGSRRRGPPVSAHELHYTMNRAVSEDLKRKTFLPYKQGILGRLAFNPAVHALANGFGFSRK